MCPALTFPVTQFIYSLPNTDTGLSWPNGSGAGFTNDLWETLTYGELLKHEFYLILRNFGGVSYSNNFIKCLCKKTRCILIHKFLELGKICVPKIHRKIRSPVNCSGIRPLGCRSNYLSPNRGTTRTRTEAQQAHKRINHNLASYYFFTVIPP